MSLSTIGTVLPKPILKHNNIMNGMLPIQFINKKSMPELDDNVVLFIHFHYEYQPPNSKTPIQDVLAFNFLNVDTLNSFYFKIPLFFQPYKLKYHLQMILCNYQQEIIDSADSDVYNVDIPPFIFEPTYTVTENDIIEYDEDPDGKDSMIRVAKVLQVLPDNKIKIEFLDHYQDNDIDNIEIVIESFNVCLYEPDPEFIIDITMDSKAKAITEMICGVDNEGTNKYETIRTALDDLVSDTMDDEPFDGNQMLVVHRWQARCEFFASHIYEFLYPKRCYYRVKCPLGNTNLKTANSAYDMGLSFDGMAESLWMWNELKPSCEICKMWMSWYEMPYVCSCQIENTMRSHAYCISCVYAMMGQYNQLKSFMEELLKSELDKHCIGEIVGYCVGTVCKFDVESDDIGNVDEDCCMIDNDKVIGSKRKVIVDTSNSRKRRRLG